MKRPEIEVILNDALPLLGEWYKDYNTALRLMTPTGGRQELEKLIEICEYVLYLEAEGCKIAEAATAMPRATSPLSDDEMETFDEETDELTDGFFDDVGDAFIAALGAGLI